MREPLNEISINDIKYINCSNDYKPWEIKTGFAYGNKEWPAYRDWTFELKTIQNVICSARETALQESNENYSEQMQVLVAAERNYYVLANDF